MDFIKLSQLLTQYLKDASPGGLLNPEWTPERVQNASGLLQDFTPVVGGVKGAIENGKAGNYGMAALNAASVPLDVATMGGGALVKYGLLSGMLKTPKGIIPETYSDVSKLTDRLRNLLSDANANVVDRATSAISPSEYFYIKGAADDPLKFRISNHSDVHGADFSVAPGDSTFEQGLDWLRKNGINVASRVSPINSQRDALVKKFAYGEFNGPTSAPLYQELWKGAMGAGSKSELDGIYTRAAQELGFKK